MNDENKRVEDNIRKLVQTTNILRIFNLITAGVVLIYVVSQRGPIAFAAAILAISVIAEIVLTRFLFRTRLRKNVLQETNNR